jgi:hypothetical protein
MRRQALEGGTRNDGNTIGMVQGDTGFQDTLTTEANDKTALNRENVFFVRLDLLEAPR